MTSTQVDLVARAADVLGITGEAWAVLQDTTRNVIVRACLDKEGMGLKAAKAVQGNHRRGKDPKATAYRCPFSPPDHHWHVGHPPSIESVATIADAIRDLHGNLPERAHHG